MPRTPTQNPRRRTQPTKRRRCADSPPRRLTSLRLQLAKAVTCDSQAGLIPADNKQFYGWLPVEDAIARDECFAVKTADDILALDCDEPSGAETVWKIRDLLAHFDITSVVLRSGGPGRLHLFAWVPDNRLLAAVSRSAQGAGVDSADGPLHAPAVDSSPAEPRGAAPGSD